jgi:polysaccharide export outer membrane protein
MSQAILLVIACILYAGCASQRPFDAASMGFPNLETDAPIQATGSASQAAAVRAAPSGTGMAVMEHDLAASSFPAHLTVPRELEKVPHPTYVIEPPDVLLVDAARLIPLPPYKIEPLDAIAIFVTNTLPKMDINAVFSVDPSGMVDLGFTYGSVTVAGQTLKEAKKTIEDHLKAKLNPPYEVYVSLAEMKAMQQIRGEHLVRQDGTIGLGTYGSVFVTGLTIAQARAAIEAHLSQFLFQPKVSVDVAGFNSHVYFIIFDFPGAAGQLMHRRPITGNETVLDALSDFPVRGLPAGVSKRRIWVARPCPGRTEILPVDWTAITRTGSTATNYQILPGDRIFVAQDPCLAVDTVLARIFAPVERIFGITLFGNSVVQSIANPNNSGIGGTR